MANWYRRLALTHRIIAFHRTLDLVRLLEDAAPVGNPCLPMQRDGRLGVPRPAISFPVPAGKRAEGRQGVVSQDAVQPKIVGSSPFFLQVLIGPPVILPSQRSPAINRRRTGNSSTQSHGRRWRQGPATWVSMGRSPSTCASVGHIVRCWLARTSTQRRHGCSVANPPWA